MAKTIFTKGQQVTLQSRVGLSPRTPTEFTVLMRLPDNQGKAQYRIRNEEQGHERVEQGSNLELIASDGVIVKSGVQAFFMRRPDPGLMA